MSKASISEGQFSPFLARPAPRREMRKRLMYTALFTAPLLLSSLGASTFHEPQYKYFPKQVTLHGVLRERSLGRADSKAIPKNDVHVRIPVLALPSPITVVPDPADKDSPSSDPTYHVRVIQLFWDHGTDTLNPMSLVGKRISVTGTLDERIAPGQVTDVTMSVISFKEETISETRPKVR